MFKFMLGMIVGIVLAMNVNLTKVYNDIEFQSKQIEIPIPTFKQDKYTARVTCIYIQIGELI